MKNISIIITGKRSFTDYYIFSSVLDAFLREIRVKVLMYKIDEFDSYASVDQWYRDNYRFKIICGMATGTDLLAIEYCIKNKHRGIELVPFEPQFWKYGEKAGEVRNQAMLDYIKDADESYVYAFWDGTPGGTEDMIHRAELANVDLRIFDIRS